MYISRALSYFYEAEFEIWAGLGPAGSIENFCNFAMKYPTFEGVFFHIFMDKTSTKLEFLHNVAIDFHKSKNIVIFLLKSVLFWIKIV